MKYCIDLILSNAVFKFIFSHFPFSELSVLNGFNFFLDGVTVTTENNAEIMNTCMKTIYVNCGVKNYLKEDQRSYICNLYCKASLAQVAFYMSQELYLTSM